MTDSDRKVAVLLKQLSPENLEAARKKIDDLYREHVSDRKRRITARGLKVIEGGRLKLTARR